MNEKELVTSILERYHKEFRYMKEAQIINSRKVRGKFIVENSAHLDGKVLEHLAITETQMCLNQLLQIYIYKLIEEEHIKEWGQIKWDDYWGKLSSEHLFVVESNIEFNEKITPNREFYGKLILNEEFKSSKGNYHLKFHFDFDDGAHVGSIRVAFVP